MNPLRVIIVEDEAGAANQLGILLQSLNENIEVLSILSSIEETIAWISSNTLPDLGFFDIQLEDGLSFEIFRHTRISFPVIFTTAYDQYAIEAFKVNSIDYLLKPIKEDTLRFSINKYRSLANPSFDHEVIKRMMHILEEKQRELTLLIHIKDRLIPIRVEDFAFFYLENGLLRGFTKSNQAFPIDQTIEELQTKLSGRQFFRANRQVIVNRSAVHEIEFYFNGRLLLKLSPPARSPVLISKARVPAFKAWLGNC